MSSSRPRAALMHVPKTAGTSLRAAMDTCFAADDFMSGSLDDTLFGDFTDFASIARSAAVFETPPSDIGTARAAAGHMRLSTLELGFAAADIATMLREPRVRLLSHYTYWRGYTEDDHQAWGTFTAARAAQGTIRQFLADPNVAFQTDNLIARFLLPADVRVRATAFISANDVEALTEIAWERLQSLGFADTVELAGAFDRFCAWLGAATPPPVLNTTEINAATSIPVADLMSPATHRLLDERTRIDRQLWTRLVRARGCDDPHALADEALERQILQVSGLVVTGGPHAGHWHRYDVDIDMTNDEDSKVLALRRVGDAVDVLELGASTGRMTEVMQAGGCRVTAVEFDRSAARHAARFATRTIVADLDDPDALAPVAAERFDLVMATDVLEHLRDPLAALRRAVALLRPGGRVVLSIPNVAHADVRLALLAGRFPYADLGLLDRTHISLFTIDRVHELLEACALDAIDWHRVQRSVGHTEVPRPDDLIEWGRAAFAADSEATTYQWIIECRVGTEPPVRHSSGPMLTLSDLHRASQGDPSGLADAGDGAPSKPTVAVQGAPAGGSWWKRSAARRWLADISRPARRRLRR